MKLRWCIATSPLRQDHCEVAKNIWVFSSISSITRCNMISMKYCIGMVNVCFIKQNSMYNSLKRFFLPHLTPLNTIEIARAPLLANMHHLQEIFGGVVFPVLKSNAYGHGLQQVSTILSKTNCPYICVDSFPEYQIVRRRAQKPVLVMWETNPQNYHLYKYDATLAVSSLSTLRVLATMHHPRKIHLFLNTGMHREWLQQPQLTEALHLLTSAKHLHVEWIMSHLACADELDDTLTHQQVALFHAMYAQIINAWFTPYRKHIANSAGISKVHDSLFNASRSGIAMYGYMPVQHNDSHAVQYDRLQPVFRVLTTVVGLQQLQPWESISYGATYTAGQNMQTATLPFGYYEGLPRAVSNQWMVRRQEHYLPVRWRICMNLCSIDTLGYPVQQGDRIEIVGTNPWAPNTIEAIARLSGTISYEILTKFSEKTRRTIVS